MRAIMDKLYACVTEIDQVIRRQRHALATIDALENMRQLEKARKHIRAAMIDLTTIEGEALPTKASSSPLQTSSPTPGA